MTRPGVSIPWAFAMSASRSWQADSVDSGCSSYTQTSPPHPEPCCSGVDSIHGHPIAGQADPYHPKKSQPPPSKVSRRGKGFSGTPRGFAKQRPEDSGCAPDPSGETEGMGGERAKATKADRRSHSRMTDATERDSPSDWDCGERAVGLGR